MESRLSVLGGVPAFEKPTKESIYIPNWSSFREMIDGIFSRKYYTNHGVLAQELEDKFSDLLQVKHAICMTNTGIGLMIAVKALGLRGKVILPSFSHISVTQALSWAGLTPINCDVKFEDLQLNTELLESLIDSSTTAILGVNHFGFGSDYEKIEEIAVNKSLQSFFISTDAIGQKVGGKKIGNFGVCEIFSLHESNIISSTDGCVITTNDDAIAGRLRNMRSSYGSGPKVSIEFTGNGRMSEVQAGMALETLKRFKENVVKNRVVFETYASDLAEVEGLQIVYPKDEVSNRNYQRFVIFIRGTEFGLNANQVLKVLERENLYLKNLRLNAPFQIEKAQVATDSVGLKLSSNLMELPVNGIEPNVAKRICNLIKAIKEKTEEIRTELND